MSTRKATIGKPRKIPSLTAVLSPFMWGAWLLEDTEEFAGKVGVLPDLFPK